MTTVSAITLPATVVTDNRRPAVVWSITGGTQAVVEIRVFSAAQYSVPGFTPETGVVTFYLRAPGSQLSRTITTDLANGTSYRVYVRVSDTTELAGFNWSPWVSRDFSIAIPVPTPTNLSPVAGATLTTGRPALNAWAAQMPSLVRQRRQWQFATNAGFTTGVVTITEENLSTSPVGAYAYPAASPTLAQGTWYLRCRSVDEYSQVGPYTATHQLTIAHAPSTGAHEPKSGNAVAWNGGSIPVIWNFSDPFTGDSQRAYQVQAWKLADPAGSTIDTGTIVSSTLEHTLSLNSTYKDQQLVWRVRVQDQDSVWSDWSPNNLFIAYDVPTVTVTGPTEGGVVNTPRPTVTWTFAATGGRTQAQYQVTILNVTDNVVADRSGFLGGPTLTWTPAFPVVTLGKTFRAFVEAYDNLGLYDFDSNDFTATYTAPSTPTFAVDISLFADLGGIVIDWTGATPSADFVAWRVYRRAVGDTFWKRLAELSSTVGSFIDYTAPANTDIEYAVVQVTNDAVFGTQVESTYEGEVVRAASENYFIVVPSAPELNIRLTNVTADDFREEYEEATMTLLGRGRRHEVGTRLGYAGTLTAQLYDDLASSARTKRLTIDAIRNSGRDAFLRNPFGDVWAIGLMSASYSRIPGVGTNEYSTATIEYFEIEEPA